MTPISCVGHVHLIFFGYFSFASGSQREPHFQSAMYISCIFHVVCASFSALATRKLADAEANSSGIWALVNLVTGTENLMLLLLLRLIPGGFILSECSESSGCSTILDLRDWSSITGRGGATKREGGGQVKFYPYEKGGRKKF